MFLYGLIGNKLEHSFSKTYFTDKFKKENLSDHDYELFELESISDFPQLLEKKKNLKGLNITIPYKKSIIQYLDETDNLVKTIQAVNTIKISVKNNKQVLQGYNTDIYGFETSLKMIINHNNYQALVLGTGGASQAICFVLKKMGIDYIRVSRKKQDNCITYSEIDNHMVINSNLIINCTPLGMYPDINSIPPISLEKVGNKHIIYDLVYNPVETRFITEGKKRGARCINGYSMLVLQAERSWQIWNSI